MNFSSLLVSSTLGAAILLGLSGCGGGGGSSSTPSAAIDGAAVFPAGLAVDSPVGMENTSATLAHAAPVARFRALAMALAQGDLRAAGHAASQLLPMADA